MSSEGNFLTPTLAGNFLYLAKNFRHSQETFCISQENFWTTQSSKTLLGGNILKISQEDFRYSELQNRYYIPANPLKEGPSRPPSFWSSIAEVRSIVVKEREFCAKRKMRDFFFATLGRKSAGVLRDRKIYSLKKILGRFLPEILFL